MNTRAFSSILSARRISVRLLGMDGMMAVSSPTGISPAQGTPRLSSSAATAGGFGVGGRFAVYRQIAAQQQIHDPAHGGVVGGAFQRPQLAVKQDAVLLAEAVQPRHAGSCRP